MRHGMTLPADSCAEFDRETNAALVEVRGIGLAALLAALGNASHNSRLLPRYFFDAQRVSRALEHFRRMQNPQAQLDSPDFIESFLHGTPVQIVSKDGSVIVLEVSDYEAVHGEGLAAQVVDYVRRTKSTDTRNLCRYEPEPASALSIALALGVVLAALLLLLMVMGMPKFKF